MANALKFAVTRCSARELPSAVQSSAPLLPRGLASYPVDRGFIDAEVPGARRRAGFLAGRISKLFQSVENNVLRSSVVRARISPALCYTLARRKRTSPLSRRFLSRSGNFVLPPPKKGSRRELRYFARNISRCFSSIDVAPPPPPFFRHLSPPSASPSSASSAPFAPSPIFLSSYDSNSLDHTFAMFHPSNFARHRHHQHHRHPPFSLLLFFFLFPATSAGTLVPFPLAVAFLPLPSP